jgi:CRISPR-associated protein Csx17
MPGIALGGCTATPFAGYLKALSVLRLVSEQADPAATGRWEKDTFFLDSALDSEALLTFFITQYKPTPILAPWNAGSGFYEKDRKVGIDAIAGSFDPRFAAYKNAIAIIRNLAEVTRGRAEKSDEDNRRAAILRACRNLLPDQAVEWVDATVGISATGERAFAPVLGTGGNEGRLDYTNNFMERLSTLLISPVKKTPVRALLSNALFATPASGFEDGAAGQFDPGKAGGPNQGQGIEQKSPVNPWDLVLTLEGAVAWASGLYRRQGVGFRSFLCSPFTVNGSAVGYGSSSDKDDSRAEIWAPLWPNRTCYSEIKVLLREGRADVSGRPAKTGMQFAEAVSSLGVDRGIDRFVRYSLLKRRGDSYVALPAGIFPTGYRSSSDRVRQIEAVLKSLEVPDPYVSLKRSVESAMFEALLHDNSDRIRSLMAALGRLLQRLVTIAGTSFPRASLDANVWLAACGANQCVEVRIAAALASIVERDGKEIISIRDNLIAASRTFAWTGRTFVDRLVSVLDRRLQNATAKEAKYNPCGGSCRIHPGDITLFIEGSTDDSLIEDLFFGFSVLSWKDVENLVGETVDSLPLYQLLKLNFMPGTILISGEQRQVRADSRIVPLLRSGSVADAAAIANLRLRVAGLSPLDIPFFGGFDEMRLAASLLIPVRAGNQFGAAVLHLKEDQESYASQGN